jgi:hypothetical protein
MIIVLLPVLAFLVAAGFSLGTSNDGDDEPAASTEPAPLEVQVSNVSQVQSQPQTPAAPPPVQVRTDCAAIRGSDYRNEEERAWFQANCTETARASTNTSQVSNAAVSNAANSSAAANAQNSTTSNSSSAGNTTPSAPLQSSAPPAPAAPAPAPAAVIPSGGSTEQVPSGQTLVIPAAGINADIYITTMYGGAMPDPKGYFNALAYDMSALGLGGDANSGNLVLSGHVDCGRCYNGGAGAAVFWSVRELPIGASAQVYTADGRIVNYVVSNSIVYSAGIDFASIVHPTAADMTIITCTGTFSGGHYDNRHVVQFRKV